MKIDKIVFLILLSLVIFSNAVSQTILSDDGVSTIQSTSGFWTYSVNENQLLKFESNWTGGGIPNTSVIDILNVGRPSGSTMPYVSGTPPFVETFFNWIPSYCAATGSNYVFDVWKRNDGLNLIHDTITIQVNNVNRLPQFSSTMPCYAEVRAGRDRLKFDFTVTDQDQLQCGDDSLFPVTKNGIPYNVGSLKSGFPANTYTYEFRPGFSDIGTHKVTFSVSDSKGGTTTKFLTIKVIDKYAQLSSSLRYACIDPVANIG